MLSAGLSMALPVVIFASLGQPTAGVLVALGALLVASSGHEGALRARAIDPGVTAAIGLGAIWAGMLR